MNANEINFYNDVVNGKINLIEISCGEVAISQSEAMRLQNLGVSLVGDVELVADLEANLREII